LHGENGYRSEAKLGTLLFSHRPFYRLDFSLHPHELIAVDLPRGCGMKALNQGAAPADQLVTQR